ncbi:MAG: 1,4-dihydroxy-2-naphthoate octaprenyltransferase [Bacteroidales bacterium]|jgi:1,4-dihydroxy-2-naphthoate octaprenyltransferase|nr:MAG: 1,4-dihydroxy-2-naphthoate octaprenyltransferase [Bacteroidales bacterium]
MIKPWIEAMRLRTLPVSIAGVITAVGFALHDRVFQWLPALLCLLFAVLAQIASNFANEYYDYRDGLDRAGREGPRRGVTEGDITPGAMKRATYAVLALACVIGLSLIYWGGWWLLPAGIVIALGAIAYSAGPYPLSRHGLGEVAVMFFFGIIPVNLTYYIQADAFTMPVLLGSVAIGLMGANVLLVNNYRDADDDASVGKNTLAVLLGRRTALALYLLNGILAGVLMIRLVAPVITILYILAHCCLWNFMRTHRGAALNPILGMTAMLMFVYSVAFAIAVA